MQIKVVSCRRSHLLNARVGKVRESEEREEDEPVV
jgi:hypothetical protein